MSVFNLDSTVTFSKVPSIWTREAGNSVSKNPLSCAALTIPWDLESKTEGDSLIFQRWLRPDVRFTFASWPFLFFFFTLAPSWDSAALLLGTEALSTLVHRAPGLRKHGARHSQWLLLKPLPFAGSWLPSTCLVLTWPPPCMLTSLTYGLTAP